MKKSLTCIICPKGCTLEAEIVSDRIVVTGNSCTRGKRYAIDECLHPMRTLTATVRVANRTHTMVSVKTSVPIAKSNMLDAMATLRKISVKAPLNIGDIILDDLCGSAVVVTKSIE